MNTPTTSVMDNPNWTFEEKEPVGFAARLNILQPSDFDDEPTAPYFRDRSLVVEVEESDIIDELTDEDVDEFVATLNRDYDIFALVREYVKR